MPNLVTDTHRISNIDCHKTRLTQWGNARDSRQNTKHALLHRLTLLSYTQLHAQKSRHAKAKRPQQNNSARKPGRHMQCSGLRKRLNSKSTSSPRWRLANIPQDSLSDGHLKPGVRIENCKCRLL